jgi:hypothetical protein
MAIQKPLQTKEYKLRDEIASRVMLINRDVVDNHDGTTSTNFSAIIYPKHITYELDANDNKTGIYEEKDLAPVTITPTELYGLFTIPVTLDDGTKSYFGEILSNFADQLIGINIGKTEEDIITTQHIDISSIISPVAPVVPPVEPPPVEPPPVEPQP